MDVACRMMESYNINAAHDIATHVWSGYRIFFFFDYEIIYVALGLVSVLFDTLFHELFFLWSKSQSFHPWSHFLNPLQGQGLLEIIAACTVWEDTAYARDRSALNHTQETNTFILTPTGNRVSTSLLCLWTEGRKRRRGEWAYSTICTEQAGAGRRFPPGIF